MTNRERLELAADLARQGASRASIVRQTGLTADQVDEIKKRVRQ